MRMGIPVKATVRADVSDRVRRASACRAARSGAPARRWRALAFSVALVLIAAPSAPAAGLLENQVDLSSVVLVGCTDSDTCKEQSTSTTAELYSQDVDTFTARLGLNLN